MQRLETDSFGPIEIESERYWGAQTQRSLEHFDIGRSRFVFTRPVIRALGQVKRSAALAYGELGLLPDPVAIIEEITVRLEPAVTALRRTLEVCRVGRWTSSQSVERTCKTLPRSRSGR